MCQDPGTVFGRILGPCECFDFFPPMPSDTSAGRPLASGLPTAGPPSVEEQRLSELHRWLTAGGTTGALAALAFVAPYGLIVALLAAAALLFAPYMLWRLAQCRRYGWIAAFVLGVGPPATLALAAPPTGATAFLASGAALFAFYGYVWLLRHRLGEQIHEMQWRRAFERDLHVE